MKKYYSLTLILTATLLTSCASAYRAQSFWSDSGYKDEALPNNKVIISYSVPPLFSSIEKANGLAMRRAAEYTKQHGFRYFVLLSKDRTTSYHETGIGGSPVEMPYPTVEITIQMTNSRSANAYSVD